MFSPPAMILFASAVRRRRSTGRIPSRRRGACCRSILTVVAPGWRPATTLRRNSSVRIIRRPSAILREIEMAKPLIPPVTATIAAGTAYTGSIDLTAGALAYIIGPAGWDEAEISFQVSNDGTTFHDLFDNEGYEVTRPVVVQAAVR